METETVCGSMDADPIMTHGGIVSMRLAVPTRLAAAASIFAVLVSLLLTTFPSRALYGGINP
jgi:hypothetical protein